jgi:NitT/TauT family transport system permease protein
MKLAATEPRLDQAPGRERRRSAQRRDVALAASGGGAWACLGGSVLPPVAIGAVALVAWEALVRLKAIPPYILPGPLTIAATLVKDWHTLYPSLLVTLAVTGAALLVATVAGSAIAILFAQSKWVERTSSRTRDPSRSRSAIAPLISIWVKNIGSRS